MSNDFKNFYLPLIIFLVCLFSLPLFIINQIPYDADKQVAHAIGSFIGEINKGIQENK
jgi:hypothetical protein